MSQVYRFLANAPGVITFGNIANAETTLQISQSKSSIGDKKDRVAVLRNSFVLRTPETVNLTPDCAGSCNKARATRVVEVRTSSPQVSKAVLLADLAELVRIIKLSDETYGVFDGFLPPINADFHASV